MAIRSRDKSTSNGVPYHNAKKWHNAIKHIICVAIKARILGRFFLHTGALLRQFTQVEFCWAPDARVDISI